VLTVKAFFMNHIVYGVLSPIYLFVIRSHLPLPNDDLHKRLKQLDWLGMALNAGMYTSFVLGLTIGGTVWPWNDRRTISILVVFSIVTIAFALQQSFCILTTPTSRLFPIRFLRSRTFLLLFISQSSIQCALGIPIYYIPLYFQFARAETAVKSATRLLPLVIVNIVVVFLNGALLPRFKYYLPWYLAAGAFITAGGASLFATLTPSTSTTSIYGFTVLLAIGTGLAQQCAYSIASAKVLDRVSDAIGFINNAQTGSTVISLTLTSLIFQNVGFQQVKSALDGFGFSNEEMRSALGGARSRVFDEGVLNEEVRRRVEAGIVEAIRWSFFPVLLGGSIAVVASLLMRWENVFDKANTTVADVEPEETKV
jgi:MFS family permease